MDDINSEDGNIEQDLDEFTDNDICSRSSSPDIDYETLANLEQNYEEDGYNPENSIESTKNYTKNEDQNSDKSDDLYNYDPGCDYE